ncbi:alpha/beta hydrolase [Cyanobacteria bacterium FACHB-471]|nr:alpha/beta hydrolase [Cyanobacteria bacterium FACHB-471]
MNCSEPASSFTARHVRSRPFALTQRSARWFKSKIKSILIPAVLPAVLVASPASAAERIYFSYGIIERSISIDSLEIYAEEGTIEADLEAYSRYATPEQLEQLRTLLSAKAELSPVAIAQFLYTDQGEILLRRLGAIIQTEARQSGFYAIRSALILAADDPEGLTPLNVLRKFPVTGIRIDLSRTLSVVSNLEQLINQTTEAVNAIEQQSELEAASDPMTDSSSPPDPRRLGSFTWQRQTITLNDPSRDRTFVADVYLPLEATGDPNYPLAPVASARVIIMSHGLGSDRTTYRYLGEHLASYGFAVAIPEHPGSNADQLQALVEGRASQVTEPAEFINRPLDVTYLLDELERLNQSDFAFQGRLNLQQVGVVGQSFGGYTALALAGAKINFQQLAEDCAAEESTLNLSLLLQCRAEELVPPAIDLRDERVVSIMAINPIGSIILGPAGFSEIDIPVMLVSGNADTVAPALFEQIRPFTWLTTPNKYLLMIRGSTHFSTIGTSETSSEIVTLPPEIIGPSPAVARSYIDAMSTAFFQVHLVKDADYLDYLRAAYTERISEPTLPIDLVRFLTPAQLAQALREPIESSSRLPSNSSSSLN